MSQKQTLIDITNLKTKKQTESNGKEQTITMLKNKIIANDRMQKTLSFD